MLALILVLVPAALSAQGRRGEGRGRMDMQGRMGMMGERGNLARALIDRRAEIGLNDEQVNRLEELAKSMEETRAAMRASMRTTRDSGVARRRMSEDDRAAMQAWRDRMSESARAMTEGIRSTLTEEQWQQVGTRMRGQARGQARRGGPGMQSHRPPRPPRTPGMGPRGPRGPQAGPPAMRFRPRARTPGLREFRGHVLPQGPPAAAFRPLPPVRRFTPLVPRDTLRPRVRRWM